ncbi:valine--tRNA ligase [Candidatus Micrarchaeota archaeon]|nr:valine--tRNA ligase [Candidatus Micrarchaeota archaeon]
MLDKYEKNSIEVKWQQKWEELGVYKFDEDSSKPVYSIDSPPPFTSGDLHMGHVLSYSYFDFVARYKRMKGFNVFYPQGWDCQGFPTEVKVESKFGRNMPREEFRKHCVEWTEKYIDRMRSQMKSLGFSPDWKYEYKTMAPAYHKKVQHSLLKMFEQKLIYRTEHPVFWCTNCASAIAKAETDELERETILNYIKFKLGDEDLLIATTRPELIHACVAILVHPDDERYKGKAGKEVTTPIFEKKVPLILDKDVDPNFGTGAVMVCTFGDKTDVVWVYRHSLNVIRAMDERGRLCNADFLNGLKSEEARKKILEELQNKNLLLKQEKLKQVIKIHDRCSRPVEYILSMQWFAKLKGMEEDIIKAAKSMRWVPEYTIQYLIDWTNFIEWDWCISRQRIYGTPLPFWYCKNCNSIATPSFEELPVNPPADKERTCSKCNEKLIPETSTCDCWVDSSITPLTIAQWPENQKLFSKVYPSSLRPQGTEIIRTWAFYTIYRCLMLTGKAPFRELLLNGNVLAPDGKKMSKSLGNIIPPDDLLTKYSADAVRGWVALSGALAKDRPFSYKDIAFAQSFQNKLWNASKFIESSIKDYEHKEKIPNLRPIDKWILSRLNKLTSLCTESFENFDFHAHITSLHEFFWHEFCDYYLEYVKHRIYQSQTYGEESKAAAQYTLHEVLFAILKLLAPVAPHITEEIYQGIFLPQAKIQSIHSSPWPLANNDLINEKAEATGSLLNKLISEIRKYKADHQMALNSEIEKAEITLPKDQLASLKEIEEEINAAGKIKNIQAKEGEFSLNIS